MKDILDVKAELEKVMTLGRSDCSDKWDVLNMVRVVIAGIREEEEEIPQVKAYNRSSPYQEFKED